MSGRLRTSALVLVLVAAAAPLAADDVPYLTGRVVDEANILSAGARTRLTSVLKAHEEATTNQVVVLTVPSIEPESIEDYAVRVFASWKLGQKGKDNGVLVIVVPNDHKMRIEVGYGLESSLPDGRCGQIIRTVMAPAFKANDYDRGVEQGIAAIVGQLEGKGTLPVESPGGEASGSGHLRVETPDMDWPQRILFGAFSFSIIGLFTVIGVMTPGVGWFLYVFLIPFWAMFPMVIIGAEPALVLLAVYLIGYPAVKIALGRTAWYQKAAKDLKTKGRASVGGFTFTSGGSGGGGFSSGGGFSGGGGSSGGGGASGGW